MDWNNVNVFEVGEGGEGGGNYFVQPHPATGASVAVVSASDSVVDSMNMIPVEQQQGSGVVLRTLEGFNPGEGVEVIGILEDGQMLGDMHQMTTLNLTPEELAQLQLQVQEQERQQQQGIIIPPTGVTEGALVQEPEAGTSSVSGGGEVVVPPVQESVIVAPLACHDQAIISRDSTPPIRSESVIVTDNKVEVVSEAKMVDVKVEEDGTQVPNENSQTLIAGEAAGNVKDAPMALPEKEVPEHTENETSKGDSKDQLTTDAGTSTGLICGENKSNEDEEVVKTEENEPTKDPGGIEPMEVSSEVPAPNAGSVNVEKDLKSDTLPAADTEKMLPPRPPSQQQTIIVDPMTGNTIDVVNTAGKTLNGSNEQKCQVVEPEEVIINERDYELLNDVSDENDDVIYVSSDEEDEGFRIQVQNARTMQKAKQPVENSAATYRPRYVSRQLLDIKHPQCRGLSFKDILYQAIHEDKILPDLNEQVLPPNARAGLITSGHFVTKGSDGGSIIFSKSRNIKMYHSSFSARFEPVLADPALENYVQQYRKTLRVADWRKRLFGSKVGVNSEFESKFMDTKIGLKDLTNEAIFTIYLLLLN